MSEKIALWVIPVPALGGVARHVLDVTRVGIPGWRVIVLCEEGPLAGRLRAQGTPVVASAFGTSSGVRASRRTLARTARALRADVVHSHLAFADIINASVRLPKATRRFTTEHGIAGDDGIYHRSPAQSKIMALVHRARFHRFHGVIAVADATRDAMRRKWKVRQPITVIRNGADLPPGVEARDPSSVDGMRILSLSRLAPEKRIDELIEAFALVRDYRPDATLTIAGAGALRGDLVARADRLGIADAVTFAGFVDPETAMAAADVVAQLSVWENCSYTLLDAAARGLRIVAADVGGNREIVSEESLVMPVTPATVAQRILRNTVADDRLHPDPVAAQCEKIGDAYSGMSSRSPLR